MRWIYRYEAKSIQSWILGTDRMSELRGGSTLIEELEYLAKQAAGNALESPQGGAGGGTLTFASLADVETFARWWPMRVAEHAPGLELVHAWAREDEHPKLQESLGAARNRPWPDLPEAGPWVARAGRSGLPACQRDGDGGLLDRSTAARDAASDRDPLAGWMTEGLGPDAPREVQFQKELLKYPADEGVAIVHADGNGLGQVLHGMSTDERRKFSEKLTAASRAAGRRVVAELVRFEQREQTREHERRRPSERACDDRPLVVNGRPIVAGGDDFTFLVRGRAGLALAECWIRAFEQATERIEHPLTACAGVVWVRRGFPFHQAHELAEALCKDAKSAWRTDPQRRSRVAFERVTTSVHEGKRGDEPTVSWTLSDLRTLEALLERALRIEARGKLRAWVAEPDADRRADLWARMTEVAEPNEWSAFEDALRTFDTCRTEALRAVLQWSRVHPGRVEHRLWRHA